MESEAHTPLECSICYELLNEAMETCCGHAFCEFCINKALESSDKPTCPLCRRNPIPIHPSYALRRLADHERAKKGITKESTITPDSPAKLLHNGAAAYRRGHYAEAIRYFSDGISIEPSAVLLGNRAACHFKLKRFSSALEDYEMAEKLDTDNVKIVLGKASTLERLKEYDSAFDSFQKAAAIAIASQDAGSERDASDGLLRVRRHATFPTPFSSTTTVTTITTAKYSMHKLNNAQSFHDFYRTLTANAHDTSRTEQTFTQEKYVLPNFQLFVNKT